MLRQTPWTYMTSHQATIFSGNPEDKYLPFAKSKLLVKEYCIYEQLDALWTTERTSEKISCG
jgi:hypothetical protein